MQHSKPGSASSASFPGEAGKTQPMLNVQNVSVLYGDQEAVHDLSFSLHSGQWLMLVGPNGAGKSTMISAIAQGVPYTGRISLDGQDLKTIKQNQRARNIGILSQHNSAQYGYTVEEIVDLGRYAYRSGLFAQESSRQPLSIEEALEMTGLTTLRYKSCLALSGGELQRTFLSQVFAQNPRVLVLDEPANHLDLRYQQQVFDLIREWLTHPDRAVLSVVHDLSLARQYGTHALLLDKGRCAAYGTVEHVFAEDSLNCVYGMDVYTWMREMAMPWFDH